MNQVVVPAPGLVPGGFALFLRSNQRGLESVDLLPLCDAGGSQVITLPQGTAKLRRGEIERTQSRLAAVALFFNLIPEGRTLAFELPPQRGEPINLLTQAALLSCVGLPPIAVPLEMRARTITVVTGRIKLMAQPS